ncbi:MAG TPA: hypothetical protein VGI96_17340 [Streptosporangiaceae bacterium]|jgi:hypothetical protein
MLLCDTGSLLRQADGPLLVPSPVLGEIGYLLQSRVGPQAEVAVVRPGYIPAFTLLPAIG